MAHSFTHFLLHRDVSFASWVKMGQDFDLKKFTGSFSRVADFSAWYPSGKAAEQALMEDEQADGGIQVLQRIMSERISDQMTPGMSPLRNSAVQGILLEVLAYLCRRWMGDIQQQLPLRRADQAH